MKNNKLLLKIYLSLLIIFIITLIILAVLGNKTRIGYLTEFTFDEYHINRTLELNGLNIDETKKLFISNNQLNNEALINYIFTNEAVTNYSYGFRIKYYSKVFRNSDIYGVYPNIDKILSENNFVKKIKMDTGGSPYGNLISEKILKYDEKIDNIIYTLKVKQKLLMTIFILLILLRIIINTNLLNMKFVIEDFIYNYNLPKYNDENTYNYIHTFINNFLISLTITIISIFIFKILNFENIKIYGISLIIITLSLYFLNNIKINYFYKIYNDIFSNYSGKIIVLLIITTFILSILNTFIELREWKYPSFLQSWYELLINGNINLFLIELIFAFLLFFFVIKNTNKFITIFLAIIFAIFIIYCEYFPKVYDVWHHAAHFTSAFMVYNNIPYQQNMYSILGHYAILMKPFFYIFGFNVKIYSILITILSGISIISIILSIFILVKDKVYITIGLLLTLFSSIFFISHVQYIALRPLRIFFPSIMILYITVVGSKKNILFLIIGYLLASLSILWNAETGIVLSISLLIANIYIYCYDYTLKDKEFYFNIIKQFIFFIASILFSYTILNIFNVYLLHGKHQTIEDLLFPLLTGQVKYTEIKINKFFNYWLIVVLLFLIPFLFYLKEMRIFKNNYHQNIKNYYPTIIYISVSALGVFSYCINRTAFFNSTIIFPMMLIIMPFLLYRLHILYFNLYKNTNFQQIKNITLSLFIIGMLFTMFMSVNNYNIFYKYLFNKLDDNIFKETNVSTTFYNYMINKDKSDGRDVIITEFMKKYGYNGIASFGGYFEYGYANLNWTNSLILPNISDWWNPSFGYSNAIKIFLDKQPNIFLSEEKIYDPPFYINNDYISCINNFNEFIKKNYTNIPTEYQKYNLYIYKKIDKSQ
ncbi:hypothetical protein [Brachyspira intermedia]|uniref:hypothetical protein n=1 Tax=Brachyspira intermedia TaxID=84377 RepID=UPI0030061C73